MQPPDDNREPSQSIAAPRRTQFGLRTLLLTITAIAILLAAARFFEGFGFLLAVLYFGGIVALIMATGWALDKRSILALPFALAAIMMIPAIFPSVPSRRAHEAANRNSCLNNLKQIGLAIQNYESIHSTMPPVFSIDQDGNPLTSWRSFILLNFDEQDLLPRYRSDEPYDSENNQPISEILVQNFVCPSEDKNSANQTNYVAILAPGSAWQPGRGTKLADIKDNLADTILLVELKNSGIGWTEPRDLDLNNLPPGITQQNLLTSLSNHPGHFNALFADGHVESIPTTIPWSDFLALITIAGGETIDRSKW